MQGPRRQRFAVNLVAGSARDPEFVSWLRERLEGSGVASRLLFAFSEYTAAAYPQAVKALIDRFEGLGAACARWTTSDLPDANHQLWARLMAKARNESRESMSRNER